MLNFIQLSWFVSEMTYTVSSGTLNSTIPYHTYSGVVLFSFIFRVRVSYRV